MHSTVNYAASKAGDGYPTQLYIEDEVAGDVLVWFRNSGQMADLISTLEKAKAEQERIEEREARPARQVDGCICGSPDLPAFDHVKGCPRRNGEVAA